MDEERLGCGLFLFIIILVLLKLAIFALSTVIVFIGIVLASLVGAGLVILLGKAFTCVFIRDPENKNTTQSVFRVLGVIAGIIILVIGVIGLTEGIHQFDFSAYFWE